MPKATSVGVADFEPIPAGSTLGICYAVVDIGTPPQHGNFPSHRSVMLIFELPHVRSDFIVGGQKVNLPRAISQTYTLSLNKKSNLRKTLVGWRGRDFTAAEEAGFEVGNVVGAMALLSLVHKKSADGTKIYTNIATIMKPMAGTDKLQPENPKIVFDIPAEGPIAIPATLPEWIVNKIKTSEEYIARSNPQREPTAAPYDNQAFPTAQENIEEDIPF